MEVPMDWWLLFAVFLYIVCAALIVAEVFIPSGGLLTISAVLALMGGVAIFFHHSPTAGVLGILVALVMVPTLLALAYKLLPRTRFGRQVLLAPPERQRGEAISDAAQLDLLVGRLGRVLTTMRPVGMCEFDGHRVECVAESGYVQRGKKVEVIHVDGTQVTVRVMEEA
jgi:membrane-bound ClpP family serine protease